MCANRWIIGVERANRHNMIVKQLPWKTSDAEGAGVQLSQDECDDNCVPHLGAGVINLTDGASPYEAFAAEDVACSPNCQRQDCLKHAASAGRDGCHGWRPRAGRASFERHYKKIQLSHGIVTHKKKEWSQVKAVAAHNMDESHRHEKHAFSQ